MTDTSFDTPKYVGTKPRLSLLSSKQSGINLRSEDHPDQQINPKALNTCGDGANNINDTSAMEQLARRRDNDKVRLVAESEFQPLNGSNQVDENKMNVSKEDLIRLLSILKSELQSKETALASIKLEQLKRLINPVEISRSSLAKTYIELQDRLKAKDQLKNSNNLIKSGEHSSSASNENQRNASLSHQQNTSSENTNKDQDNDEYHQDSLNMLSTLLELLDRHPLLALPRDSIYCLDYNCNELSTKNYLNLKIQHLDNLIDQHRRFRYYMNERLKRSEQRYIDLTLKLELERNLRLENERSMYRSSGKSVLLKHIDQLKEALEKEKASKHAIVMTLLNELLDERERNETLSQKMAELEKKLAANKPPLCKPRVPAKPAQLLDKQRSQNRNK